MSATPQTVEGMQKIFAQAFRDIAWLEANLSGCEWCCGGGNERLASARGIIRQVGAWLEKRGATPAIPAPRCLGCGYYDRVFDEHMCKKCAHADDLYNRAPFGGEA